MVFGGVLFSSCSQTGIPPEVFGRRRGPELKQRKQTSAERPAGRDRRLLVAHAQIFASASEGTMPEPLARVLDSNPFRSNQLLGAGMLQAVRIPLVVSAVLQSASAAGRSARSAPGCWEQLLLSVQFSRESKDRFLLVESADLRSLQGDRAEQGKNLVFD
jgi:hypothetical protein